MKTKFFFPIFAAMIITPLLIFDLIFDDKQTLFFQMNESIIVGAFFVGLVLVFLFAYLNSKYEIVEKS
mgnify:CR=1 FL=1